MEAEITHEEYHVLLLETDNKFQQNINENVQTYK